jgi:hypothetical protein
MAGDMNRPHVTVGNSKSGGIALEPDAQHAAATLAYSGGVLRHDMAAFPAGTQVVLRSLQ